MTRDDSPGNGDLKGEGEDCSRGDWRDVVLLLVDSADYERHHLLHSFLKLRMPLLPNCAAAELQI